MTILRTFVPAALLAAGVVFFFMGGERNGQFGVMLGGVALVIWIFMALIKLAHGSVDDREAEEAAREEHRRTGKWPFDPEADG